MDLTYAEIKEDMKDSFINLSERSNYPVEDTFYATLDGYLSHNSSTKTEEVSIYINMSIIFLSKNKDIGFLKERLIELICDKNIDSYKEELGEEFLDFIEDLKILKKKMV